MVKVGLFGIGLDTYWAQFDGLLDKLNGILSEIESEFIELKVEVVNGGMVDNPFKSNEVARLFNRKDVDCVFLFISTYALSQNVLPLVQKVNKPLVLLNIQPTEALDYDAINALGDRGKMTGEWLSYCQSCVAPELASVLGRANIKFDLITGHLHEDCVWDEIENFISALTVVNVMKNNRIGVLGHYYNGMLDVYSDLTQQSVTFGNHFEILEFGVLKELREQVTEQEIAGKIDEFRASFAVSVECEQSELERAAKTSVALDKFVEKNQLGSLAYYYEGVGDASYQDIVTSLIPGFTLLTGKHVPVAGECEIKNVQAMKILDTLGCGGSFSEFFALDFKDDVVLLGHDGPAHFRIAEGKVGLVPLSVYHGKPGKGLSIQMKVANSAITVLSVCQNRSGEIYLLAAEGESVDGPTLNIGNTNSRYKFPISAREFTNKWSMAGPSHHCAIGIGHKAKVISKVAELMNIKCIQIC
ncbi:MAG: L-fucose/L-arabinose isomerase family protein [Bacteroidales bacterium]|nr:L-fucose/L-arabinose isomerase family protein [Bacteroidales bacterium]